MPDKKYLEEKYPRFYRAPSAEDVEVKGLANATIHERIRARIIGSRVLAATVAIGTGTAITAQEILMNSSNFKPIDIVTNFGIPAVINGFAEIKVENQLRHTERDMVNLLSEITDTTDLKAVAQPPITET